VSSRRTAIVALLACVACDQSLRRDPTLAPDAAQSSETAAPCATAADCPSDQQCFNGLCAMKCSGDGQCPAGQYCDPGWNQCHPSVVMTCAAGGCATSQTCLFGLCTAKDQPPETCDITGTDTCGTARICAATGGSNDSCVSLPPCAPDGSCPKGTRGAVCNESIVGDKGRLCLIGYCLTANDCLTGWYCTHPGGSTLGLCGNGTPGEPCSSASECDNGTCHILFPGVPGQCG
jgi:hypothetical protein